MNYYEVFEEYLNAQGILAEKFKSYLLGMFSNGLLDAYNRGQEAGYKNCKEEMKEKAK